MRFHLPHIVSLFRRRDGKQTAAIKDIRSILGKKNVDTQEDVFKIQTVKDLPRPNTVIHYSIDQVKQCALENKQKKALWGCEYCIGWSYKNLLDAQGTDPTSKDPVFLGGTEVWISDNGTPFKWFTSSSESGYRLINFKPLFVGQDFAEQEAGIKRLNPHLARLPGNVLTEALFNRYKLHKERLLQDAFHAGLSGDCVGGFQETGLILNTLPDIMPETGVITYLDPRLELERVEHNNPTT